jgi:hypothetical protein
LGAPDGAHQNPDPSAGHTHVTTAHIASTHIATAYVTTAYVTTAYIASTHITTAHIASTHITTAHIASTHITTAYVTTVDVANGHIVNTHIANAYVADHDTSHGYGWGSPFNAARCRRRTRVVDGEHTVAHIWWAAIACRPPGAPAQTLIHLPPPFEKNRPLPA